MIPLVRPKMSGGLLSDQSLHLSYDLGGVHPANAYMVGSRGYWRAVDMCHENGSELLDVTMLGGVAPPSRIQLTIRLRICLYYAVCNWNLGLPERLNTSGMMHDILDPHGSDPGHGYP
jgi:hypothetical protein